IWLRWIPSRVRIRRQVLDKIANFSSSQRQTQAWERLCPDLQLRGMVCTSIDLASTRKLMFNSSSEHQSVPILLGCVANFHKDLIPQGPLHDISLKGVAELAFWRRWCDRHDKIGDWDAVYAGFRKKYMWGLSIRSYESLLQEVPPLLTE